MQRETPVVGVSLRRAFFPTIRSIDEKTRTIEFVASDETVDRYGDIIRVANWKYQNYLKNPVFLWAHRSGDPPIGKCVDIKVEAKPPALVQTIEFADAKTYPFAETVFRLYKGGFMRAVSVGFIPLEPPTPRMDEQGNFAGYEFNAQELLELSAVPIPANQNALARAVEKGFTEADLSRVFCGEELASTESVYREIAKASLDYAELAIDIATKIVREALVKVKSLGQNEEAVSISLSQLCDAVKGAAASVQSAEITGMEELGEALKPGEITSIDQLGEIFKETPKTDSTDTLGASELLRSRQIKAR